MYSEAFTAAIAEAEELIVAAPHIDTEADLLAREARKWQSRIALVNDSQRADGKSIHELLTLAAEAGTRLVVEATGPDAREALDAIGSLFESRFNEHENDQES